MGYLYRPKLRSGDPKRIWWVKYYVNGRPIRERTGTDNETEARTFLEGREGRVAMGQPILRRADRLDPIRGGRRGPVPVLPGHPVAIAPGRRTLTGTFSGTMASMNVDSQPVSVQNRSNGPVAQADRAEVS